MVEMNVKVDSTSAEPAAGGAMAKCRRSRLPLVDGSHDAQQENAGEMAGILKNRLQNVSINFETERCGTGPPTAPAHVCGICAQASSCEREHGNSAAPPTRLRGNRENNGGKL